MTNPGRATPANSDGTTTPGRGRLALAVALTAVVFGILDGLWLTVVSGDLYRDRIGHLLADSPNAAAAAAFYVVFVLGIVYFVIRPGLARATLGPSLRDAAAFGLVTYATFDLTSMAVMKDFPLDVVLIDMAWGTIVCTATTAVVLAVLHRLGRS
ncbi:DUF2177 family protein [uncultured Phycicoccus sp.]|uniref:DUF2177 family protein n=1 Tax=uncultured Phycicoccus sp. TaxID=661422 RepID=UPI002601D7BA|nr:DUF2177 family protein [uncultured Phycicoccus sp.]